MKDEIILLADDNPILIQVTKNFGATHKIEAVLGTHVVLDGLREGQSVCFGDGKHYHFKLTKKKP